MLMKKIISNEYGKPDILNNSKGGKAKQLQLEYWTKYSEICDLLGEGDYQIIPKPQHWQYLPLGKTGISFQLTINTRDSFIGVDLCITNLTLIPSSRYLI